MQVSAAAEAELSADIQGSPREVAVEALKVSRMNATAKLIRIVKNAQYAFVQWSPDHERSAVEQAAWLIWSVQQQKQTDVCDRSDEQLLMSLVCLLCLFAPAWRSASWSRRCATRSVLSSLRRG